MAITSEIIGKLGGADVEVISVSAPYELGSQVLTSVSVQVGKQRLVAVAGEGGTSTSSLSSYPELRIGGTSAKMPTGGSNWFCVAVVTQDTDVVLYSNSNVRSRFNGTVYTVEI